ncbi:crossover junction endodeoxyribonuclease RuvC [Flaviflexus massiliensis]|uniref:crossover junction endodeoxyribonuclease RuvC n=1 Tax=Flaviflexus massiliensis TaxID=1522309 RepID=UPI0006D54675|nr:crossover junction endodeoxyribonuclease RuvC [Flaviflexus massiliensis]
MKILGVDPGLTRCGIGVIEAGAARHVDYVDVAVVRSTADMAPHRRLEIIADGIDEMMGKHSPDVVAVERMFAEDNVRSIISTAQVAGVAMLAASRAHLPLALYSPSAVKAAVTGDGRAEKRAVQLMVQRILRLKELPKPPDAADALALAITHAWRGETIDRQGTAQSAQHGGSAMPSEGAGMTAAQKAWAQAERTSRMSGIVAQQMSANARSTRKR